MTAPGRSVGGTRASIEWEGLSAFLRGGEQISESLDLTGDAAERAAVGVNQANEAAIKNAVAGDKASASNTKQMRSALQLLAAQERVTAVLNDETASVEKQARAMAGLISAQDRLRATTPAPQMAQVVREADAMVSAVGRTRSAIGGLVETAAKLGLALGGFELIKEAVEFVSAGKDLTTALNGVQAASHATDEQMAKVRATAIGLGKDLSVPGATAVDAADAINDLVRAGVKLPRALDAARPALLLAAAAQVDTADAARYLGDTLDDFRLPATQATQVANEMAGAATSAGGGLTSMFDAIKYAGPYARAAGVDLTSVLAATTELAKSGIQGSMAGTGIARMLQSLAAPSLKATSALDDLGVSAWDAQGKFVGFPSLFDQLHKAQNRFGDDTQRFTADVKNAFGARAATAVSVFAARGVAGYNEFVDRVKSGDVQKYADLMNRGVSASGAQLKKELTAAGIDIYDSLEGPLDKVLQWLGTDLPHALGEVQAELKPVEQAVEGDFVAAWHAAAAVLEVADGALVGIGHFLQDHSSTTRVTAEAVISLWAAYKGYKIVSAAANAIRESVAVMVASSRNGVGQAQKAWASYKATLAGAATESELTNAVLQRELLQTVETDLTATAAMKEADAEKAQSAATTAENIAAASEAMGLAYASEARAAADAAAETAASLQGMADEATASAAQVQEAIGAATATIEMEGAGTAAALSSMLGPFALVAGAIGIFATLMHHGASSTAEQAQAAAQARQQIENLTDAIKSDSGALGENTRAYVAHQLELDGVYAAAKKVGIAQGVVTDAALGNKDAIEQVTSKVDEWTKSASKQLGTTDQWTGKTTAQSKAIDAQGAAILKVKGAIDGTNKSVEKAVSAYKDETAGIKGSTAAKQAAVALTNTYNGLIDTSTKVQKENKVTIDGVTYAMGTEATAAGALSDALDTLSNNSIDAEQAQLQLEDSLAGVAAQEKKNGASLADNTAKGRANKESLLDQIKSINGVATAQIKNGASVGEVTKRLGDNLAALKKTYVQNGYNTAAVDRLIKKYAATPKQVVTAILADTSGAVTKVKSLQALINAVKQNRVPSVDINTMAGAAKLAQLQVMLNQLRGETVTPGLIATATQGGGHGHSASGSQSWTSDGKLPRNTVSTVGEQGWEAAVTDEHGRTQILSHRDSMRLLGYGDRVPGFAGGTGRPSTVLGPSMYSGPSGSGGPASQILFGAADLIGQALLTGVQSVGGAIIVETRGVAASMRSVLGEATKSVDSGIEKSLKQVIPANVTKPDAILGLYEQAAERDRAHAIKLTQNEDVAKKNLAAIRQHADALDADAKAAQRNANAADKAAAAAKKHSETVNSDKKATDAEKKAAADNATALQKQADAADAAAKKAAALAKAADDLATKGKSAFDKLKSAAQSADSAAQQAAQDVVSQISGMVSDLQSKISDFESTVSQGITGDDSLATMWGSLGDAVTSASSDLGSASSDAQSALSSLASAQEAVDQAQPDYQAVTDAQNAQVTATNKLTAANRALDEARSAGNLAAVTAAEMAQTQAYSDQQEAADALATATANVASATGPTADQLQALADAQATVTSTQTALTAAQNKYNQAVQDNSVAGLTKSFQRVLASAQQFSADLNTLVDDGADQDLITQIMGVSSSQGVSAADALAQQFIAAGPQGIAALQSVMTQIQDTADKEGVKLAGGFFQSGVDSIDSLIGGIDKEFPTLVQALQPYVDELQQMFTFTPTVQNTVMGAGGVGVGSGSGIGTNTAGVATYNGLEIPKVPKGFHAYYGKVNGSAQIEVAKTKASLPDSGKGFVEIPGYAKGVRNLPAATDAWVGENGPEIVRLPRGSDVYPNGLVPPPIPSSRPAAAPATTVSVNVDLSPLVTRLDSLDNRLASIEQLTATAPDAIAAAGAGLYVQAGKATAQQSARQRRRGGG